MRECARIHQERQPTVADVFSSQLCRRIAALGANSVYCLCMAFRQGFEGLKTSTITYGPPFDMPSIATDGGSV
jgi:hypothetical protein